MEDSVEKILPKTVTQLAQLNEPLELIQALPPWNYNHYGSIEIEQLKNIGKEMMAYDLDKIREALKAAKEARYDEDVNTSSKIYILMRVLFEVPDAVPYKNSKGILMSYAGFFKKRGYKGDLSLNPLGWPLVWNKGDLVEVKLCNGVKAHQIIYYFLDEFDMMRENFPRRQW
ncbi:hypothetical protein KJ940_19810 [Myxococcota bacterium]|nr:hypothetical protein [Myxococcota bacterium]